MTRGAAWLWLTVAFTSVAPRPAFAPSDLQLTRSIEYEIVNRLVIDPASPTTLYAATAYGAGILKSTNGGECWTVASDGLTNRDAMAIALDPRAPGTLYAGTWGGGVFRSTDAGRRWEPLSAGMDSTQSVADLAVAGSPPVLWAATTAGVFRRTDGDARWARAGRGLPERLHAHVLAIDPRTPRTVYVGALTGLFKTTDGGESWQDAQRGITSGWGQPGASVHAIAIDPDEPATLYAGTNGSGVFRSSSAGASWETANEGLSSISMHEGRPTPVLAAVVTALTINARAPRTVYAGTQSGLFRSTDGGTSWAPLKIKGDDSRTSLVLDPSTPSVVYAVGDGVLKSMDGGRRWQPANTLCPDAAAPRPPS